MWAVEGFAEDPPVSVFRGPVTCIRALPKICRGMESLFHGETAEDKDENLGIGKLLCALANKALKINRRDGKKDCTER